MKFDRDSFFKSGSILSLSQDTLSIGWGEGVRVSRLNIDPSRPAYYMNDFFLNASHPWVQYPHHIEIDRKSFHSLLQPKIKFKLEDCSWTVSDPENYRKGFNKLFHLIQEGKLFKGVPYLFSRASELMAKAQTESNARTNEAFEKLDRELSQKAERPLILHSIQHSPQLQ